MDKKRVLKILEGRDELNNRIESLKTQLVFLERERESFTNSLIREAA